MTCKPIVLATGSYVPEGRVASTQYMKCLAPRRPTEGVPFTEWPLLDTSWVERHFGIVTMAYDAQFPQLTKNDREHGGMYDSDMAVAAATDALNRAQLDPKQVDALVHVSCTPDKNFFLDHMRRMVQGLGLRPDIAFEYQNLGCAGLAAGLRTGSQYAKANGPGSIVLVVASNCPSGFLSRETLDNYVRAQAWFPWAWLSPAVFGDGAGAIVLQINNGIHDRGIIDVWHEVHPETTLIDYPAGGSLEHTRNESVGRHLYLMNPTSVREQFVRLMVRNLEVLQSNWHTRIEPHIGLSFDVNLPKRWYLHQANKFAVLDAARAMGLPMERVPTNIISYGNTSAASTLLLLDKDLRHGHVRAGDLVIFCWIGAGIGAMNGYAVVVI